MKRYTLLPIIFLSLLAWHCGATQPVRTLPEGETDLTSSFGGPIIPFAGVALPVPYWNGGAAYGLHRSVTVYGNLHLTALLFGDVALDGGAAVRLFDENGVRPEVTANGRMYFFWDVARGNTAVLYPMLTATGSYAVGERSLLYFGSDQMYQFSDRSLFVSPFVGWEFPAGERTILQLESKWMAMNRDTRHGVFEGFASIGGKGNLGLFFGMRYQWE